MTHRRVDLLAMLIGFGVILALVAWSISIPDVR